MPLSNCPFCKTLLVLEEDSYSCGAPDQDHEFFYMIEEGFWYLDSFEDNITAGHNSDGYFIKIFNNRKSTILIRQFDASDTFLYIKKFKNLLSFI